MGFVGSLVSGVVDVITSIVEAVVQIVEVILELVMTLLGFGGDTTTQVIEYFEVHNFPLFTDVDKSNPLLQTVQSSILSGSDISADLIFASAFRSYKGDIRKFIQYIDDDNYIEGFPQVESYITYPDYTEITSVLNTLHGAACTIENAYTRALNVTTWIKYWLQENKSYSVETNKLFLPLAISVTTSPGSTTSSFTNNTVSSNTILLALADGVAASDTVIGNEVSVNFATVSFNASANAYTVQVYDAAGTVSTLPYTVPVRPTGLHYDVTYYLDSNPAVTRLFVYKVGTGTYSDLDNPQNEININATVLHAIPAIPLRINNVDYTTRPAAEVTKINELCNLISLDASEILDKIKNDPDAPSAGDLDHVYINFGIRLWDSSQTGLVYLFTMCENLFPAQGVTKGIYDDTASGDTKPANNVIITTEDYKYLFQFSYMSYAFTSLATINANSGSAENGYYYSDLSRFNSSNYLVNPYFVSSGKGTYNVGFKADNLTQVANFLAGSGTTNPGTTTSEATNWLQVTGRMNYNNTTPVLQDADGSVSDLKFLTPDLVYENNGSGVLRHVLSASEETTAGQSITYYKAVASGLEAYTITAPIGSLRVVDGDSGKFKMVKFNLGHQDDLMFPFIHNFVANLSNKNVTQLFLSGAHASIYVAHYEVIVQRTGGFGGLFAIIMIIIIIVVAVYVAPAMFGPAATGFGTGGTLGAAGAMGTGISPMLSAMGFVGSSAGNILWGPTFMNLVVKFAVNQIIKMAVTEAFGEDSAIGQMVGTVLGAVALSGINYNYATSTIEFGFGPDAFSFDIDKFIEEWSWTDTFKFMTTDLLEIGGSILTYKAKQGFESLEEEQAAMEKRNTEKLLGLTTKEIANDELYASLFATQDTAYNTYSALTSVNVRGTAPTLLASTIYLQQEFYIGALFIDHDQSGFLDRKIEQQAGFDYA